MWLPLASGHKCEYVVSVIHVHLQAGPGLDGTRPGRLSSVSIDCDDLIAGVVLLVGLAGVVQTARQHMPQVTPTILGLIINNENVIHACGVSRRAGA